MKSILTLSILFLFCSNSANLFTQNNSNCDCSECSQFDFWVGKWNAAWQDSSGKSYMGKNIINKILDGCVIAENFDGNPGINFTGKSFSVYDRKQNVWKQTWVDSQGGYMLFTGGMKGNKMILSREVESKKGSIVQRMVFYNITDKSFDWNWEASIDYGKNWQLNWQIHYTRIGQSN